MLRLCFVFRSTLENQQIVARDEYHIQWSDGEL